jgi:SAM-dependent methyltransferase
LRTYFSLTLLLSALLLFLVQPMVAKMTLPSLGGTPAVWNTCIVFFQAALLLGYLYAHVLPKWLGVRRHAALHLFLLTVPFLVLPISLAAWHRPPGDTNPIPWLLTMLAGMVGLPFFVVATSAPLLQRWFSETGHAAARDPYFLYAASNLGSMMALLAYPFLVEPHLRLVEQSWIWLTGYALLALLIAGCALCLWRAPQQSTSSPVKRIDDAAPAAQEVAGSPLAARSSPITAIRRLRWIALSFAPSSLLLGFTTYLTTDIAAVPLLWVVPLAVYLLTFILVFASKPLLPHWLMVRLMPLAVLVTLLFLLGETTGAFWLVAPVHFVTFFLVPMVCHGELAADRPAAEHLTEFYLCMSLGGVLGGAFNALVAPLLFDTVAEYPLALALACLLLPRSRVAVDQSLWRWSDLRAPAVLAALGLIVMLGLREFGPKPGSAYRGPPPSVLLLGALIVLCLPSVRRPIRFGLCVAAVLLVHWLGPELGELGERGLHVERSFFGVHRVLVDAERRLHLLQHGTTQHGAQSLEPTRRSEPLTYYHRSGPLGQTFAALAEMKKAPAVAVVGLGTGSIACYLEPGQRLTYYEIDPSVLRIATNPEYFTFLSNTRGEVDAVLGDGRLTLAAAPDRRYGLIILDAFSSDAIPMHLVTREALALYASKLTEDGVLVFHISNRYLDLEPVLGDLAAEAGFVCRSQHESRDKIPADELAGGRLPSHYLVMARRVEHLGSLARDPRWRTVEPRPGARVWTDDYSNIISVWKW